MCNYRVLISILSAFCALSTAFQDQSWQAVVQTTYNILTQKAYPDFCLDKALPKALDALCKIDDYSQFLGPDEYAELKEITQGEFYGIGVVLAPKKTQDTYALILDCIPDSPAEKHNLQRHDKIYSIDGQPVEHLSIDDVARKLKSTQRNSLVKLSIVRNNTKIRNTLTLKRDIIRQKPISSFYFPQYRIGYCHIPLFTAHAKEQLQQALMHIKTHKPHGLILDLRDNTGGLMQAAVDCAALFLPDNTLIVSTKNRQGYIQEYFYTRSGQIVCTPTLCIILVNQYTASAGEIFAGALHYYAQRSTGPTSHYNPYVLILGTRTHGKGSVQELIPVGNNCAVKLTTGVYCLPDNTCIDNVGITPDIHIKQQNYYSALTAKNKHNTQIRKIQTDHQIHTALTLINLFSSTRTHAHANKHFETQAALSSFMRNIIITQPRSIIVNYITNV